MLLDDDDDFCDANGSKVYVGELYHVALLMVDGRYNDLGVGIAHRNYDVPGNVEFVMVSGSGYLCRQTLRPDVDTLRVRPLEWRDVPLLMYMVNMDAHHRDGWNEYPHGRDPLPGRTPEELERALPPVYITRPLQMICDEIEKLKYELAEARRDAADAKRAATEVRYTADDARPARDPFPPGYRPTPSPLHQMYLDQERRMRDLERGKAYRGDDGSEYEAEGDS